MIEEKELDAIDEEIKQKIMGWVSEDDGPRGSLEIPGMVSYYEYEDENTRHNVTHEARFFTPTADANDAFKVVEKLKSQGWGMSLYTINTLAPGNPQLCSVFFRKGSKEGVDYDESMAMAICKAALKGAAE